MTTKFSSNVSAIEGIGTEYSTALDAAGVSTLRDLLTIQPVTLHRRKPGLPLKRLRDWRSAAWLMAVDGMTPDIAECLVAAGINRISELADAGLQTLERALAKGEQQNKINDPPSLYKLAELQRAAAKDSAGTMITGFVKDQETGKFLEGTAIRVGRRTTRAGPDGSFLITGVEPGRTVLVIDSDEHSTLRLPLTTKAGRVCGPVTVQLARRDASWPAEPLPEHSGAQLQIRGESRARLKTIELQALPEDTWLRYQKDYKDGRVKLLHIHRTRIGRDVFVELVKLPRSDVPKEASLGSMLHWKNGALHASDKTMKEVSFEHYQKRRPPFTSTRVRTLVPANRLERI